MFTNENQIWLQPFVTPMLNEAYGWVADLVTSGQTGGVLYGPPRRGKTKTVELLRSELRKFKGPRGEICCETLSLIVETKKNRSEGGFWDWWLMSLRHAEAGRGSVTLKRHRTYEYVASVAARSPSGKLIILIDEAQKLDIQGLGWLADIFNYVCSMGYEVIVVLVGSYLLSAWQNDLMGTDVEHIRERFFLNEHELRGLSKVEDFKACLRHYDSHPFVTDGPSISAHFNPKWYAKGGRLSAHSSAMHEAFKSCWGGKNFSVPMAYFVRAVRVILEHDVTNPTEEDWRAIVEDTKFHQIASQLKVDAE